MKVLRLRGLSFEAALAKAGTMMNSQKFKFLAINAEFWSAYL
jgi:hypothetical protein